MYYPYSIAICFALALCVCSAGSCSKKSDNPAVDGAVVTAKTWLGLVDSGEYGDSWSQSASILKSALSAEKWDQSLIAVRKPLGELVSRKVKSTQYATSLPGAPDGEYVVIQFTTVFTNKKSAVETVTPMKDSDGVWRVSGYYIK